MLKINKEKTYDILKNKDLDISFIETIINSNRYQRIEGKYLSIIDLDNRESIKALYEIANWPFYKIGMLCGVSDSTAKKYCLSFGIKNLKHNRGNNSFNNYFETIDTKDKAYFLGLFFADGSIVKSNATYTISLILTENDSYIIEKFLKYANIETTIYTVHKEDKNPRKQININSQKMFNDLQNLGCVQNKSHAETLSIPQIREDLIPHFIRGYFDGDGIAYTNGNIGFCGHFDIITFIHNYLKPFLPYCNNNPYYNKENKIYYLTYGKNDAITISKLIYQEKEDLFLIRKYDKYRPSL